MYSLASETRSIAPSLPDASMRSKAASAGDLSPILVLKELAALAVDAAHRVDDPLVLAADRALDVDVEPAFGPATIDDPLRERRRTAGEGEDAVGAVALLTRQTKRDVRLPHRCDDVVDAIRARLDAQVRDVLRLVLRNGMACADEEVAAQRKPVLAELALVRSSPIAARKP